MRGGLGGTRESEPGNQRDLSLLGRFFPLIRKNIRMVTLSIFLMVILSLTEVTVPYVTKTAIDSYIVPGMELSNPVIELSNPVIELSNPVIELSNPSQINVRNEYLFKAAIAGGVLFLLAVARFALNFFQIIVMEYAGQRMMHDLRMQIYSHIQKLPLSYFSKNPVGRVSTRVTNDVQNMQEMFTSIITFVMKDAFMLIGIFVILLFMDFKLSLTLGFILPFIVISTLLFSRLSRGVYRQLRVNIAEINSMFSESIGGMKVIQLFTHQKRMMDDFRELNHENFIAGMRQIRIMALFMPIVDLLSSITLAMIIFYGGGRVVAESLSLGTLVAFISYTKMFFRPVRDLSEKHNILQNALASGERIVQVLDTETDKHGGQETLDTIEELSFKNVSFQYESGEENKVIEDVSFTVRKGESLAILGPTGSGKTSLINLVVRFYLPGGGEILVNGKNADAYSTKSIRARVALVTQDPYLFSGTVRQNIVPPDVDLTDEEFRNILDLSYAASVVSHLPRGADTLISQAGSSLSSGERQLISIARAFAHEPDLIIFDEATSYVDTESEEKIRIATAKLKENRTSITIAHRLRSAMTADKIIVLKDGRVIERGNHETLMSEKGFYYRLHNTEKR
ncbi:ABC-type multidrug transport system, ATP-binding protein [Desulfamplus magnetovallimortis]|uniref:ABC-type multidrug transport system, ATP-binding protein n=1 Tax=Desulfamplus magnetovallimortis TaxID=1246637 RepID=A0A1W1H8H4_9BACT|nr:ABC transporter ATP-binding protein [Desulfamplus magnetovallimortis]SLM28736.1 ABC-type multidrug transport system, ATP-binding protein [Desulfamplus magnetovallimortis]